MDKAGTPAPILQVLDQLDDCEPHGTACRVGLVPDGTAGRPPRDNWPLTRTTHCLTAGNGLALSLPGADKLHIAVITFRTTAESRVRCAVATPST